VKKYSGSAKRDTSGKPKYITVHRVLAVLIAQKEKYKAL